MFYYELVNIHHEKSGKCWHARRFGPLSAGSDSRLYCISVRPFAAARHGFEPGPGKGRHHVGGIEGEGGVAGGPVGRTRFGLGLSWEVVALAAASSPPALSHSSESKLNVACHPPQAVAPESHPSGEPERSTNLATSQLASSIQFQVYDRLRVSLSFTGKFVIAVSRPEFLRSRSSARQFRVRYHLSFQVASLKFILASSARWPNGPPSSRLVTAPGAVTPQRSAGPRQQRPCLARLPVPSWTMLVAPVVSAIGGSRTASRASRPSQCHGVQPRRWLTVTGRQSWSRGSRQSIQAMRRAGCRHGRPSVVVDSVPKATHWPLVVAV